MIGSLLLVGCTQHKHYHRSKNTDTHIQRHTHREIANLKARMGRMEKMHADMDSDDEYRVSEVNEK